MLKHRTRVAAVLCCACTTAAWAAPIRVPVQTSQSTLNVELCIQGSCDTDSSPVTGETWIKLDPFYAPSSMTLYDFQYHLTEQIDLFISYGILGNISATGQNIGLLYGTPPEPLPPTVVTAGAFTYADVPSQGIGTVTYNATGLVCALLMQSNIPCSDTINLANEGVEYGAVTGTVNVSPARVVTLVLNPDVTTPIDSNNPDLGYIRVYGTVVGTVTVPRRGDANLDGIVDGADIPAFVDVLANPAAFGWEQRFAVDMNDDDAFDDADVPPFVTCLLFNQCPGEED